jgi:hypothetical protein
MGKLFVQRLPTISGGPFGSAHFQTAMANARGWSGSFLLAIERSMTYRERSTMAGQFGRFARLARAHVQTISPVIE